MVKNQACRVYGGSGKRAAERGWEYSHVPEAEAENT
jgi:hypothetical protein